MNYQTDSKTDSKTPPTKSKSNTQSLIVLAFVCIVGLIFASNPALVSETKMAAKQHSAWTPEKRLNHSEAFIFEGLDKLKNYAQDLKAMILDLEAQQILSTQKIKNYSAQVSQLERSQNRLALDFNELNIQTQNQNQEEKSQMLAKLESAEANALPPIAIRKLKDSLKALEQKQSSPELTKLRNSIKKIAGKKSNLSKKLQLHQTNSYQGAKKLDSALAVELEINDKVLEIELMSMQARLDGNSSNPLKHDTLEEINVLLAHIQALGNSYDDLSVMDDDYFSDPAQDEAFDAIIEEALYLDSVGI